MGEYNKSAIIKYTRKALNMTQEELAEFICEPTTLARYESGKIDPTDDKFLRLMKKMGERGDIFVSPIETNLLELDWEIEQLSNAVEQQEWNVVEKIKQKLTSNRHFSLDYPENKQYLKRIEVILQYHYKKIDETEAIKQLIEAWEYTCPQYPPKHFPINRVYRETELLILHNIGIFYKIMKDYKKAYAIYERLDNYFDRPDMINDYKSTCRIYLGYSNTLGQMGKHEESIEVCFKAIKKALLDNRVNLLYNFYYNIGWNLVSLKNPNKMKEAKLYIWLAYQLCQNYPEDKDNLSKIKELYEKLD